ncbi:MAG: tryptophan-rich sensory protein [Bacteroidales bacterium]|jgi:tryptophan-rich sensory protein|nr:tryptophan-rich sensory protein [Bacteroidales bacterium]
MKYFWSILISVLVCFSVGITASYFQADSIDGWYQFLNKPSVTPPDYIFPIAWSIIYLCMGISFGIVWHLPPKRFNLLLGYFVLQLLLNFTWSILFFKLQNPALGFINIVALDMVVVLYALQAYRLNKTASFLFVPYILWLVLATYLNGYILVMN